MRLEAGGPPRQGIGGKPLHSLFSSLNLSAGWTLELSGPSGGRRNAFAAALKRRLRQEPAQRSGVRNHARYLLVVAIGNQQGPAQLPLHLRRFRSKDVPRLRLAPLDLAGTSLAEALGRARVGLQLGHFLLFVLESGSLPDRNPLAHPRETGTSLPS